MKWILAIVFLFFFVGTVSAASINLLTTNQANGGESGLTTGFSPDWSHADLTANTTDHWQGSYSIKTVTYNVENSEGIVLDCAVLPSTQYTFSVYIKGNGTGNIAIAEQTSTGGWVGWTQSSAITLNNNWTRYNVTRTFGSTGRNAHLYAFITSSKQAATIFSDGHQLEVGASETIWTEPVYLYTYPMQFINETKILPNSDTNLPAQGTTLIINATPDQYEASSFVIKPSAILTNISITATDLSDGSGHTIPKSNIDLKTVKVWYQTGYTDDIVFTTDTYDLVPELLLNNDSIIRVNTTAQTNEIWIQNATYGGYYHIDNTTIGAFPDDALVYDNKTAGGFPQNFSLLSEENKQIWITTHIPLAQDSGYYYGSIWVNSSEADSSQLNFTVRVLPFSLEPATLIHSLYYRGTIPAVAPTTLTSEEKTSTQMQLELQNMKNHGVLYPTLYQADDAKLETALTLRDTVAFPKDTLYGLGVNIGNATSVPELATISLAVTDFKVHTTAHGYTDTYFYGMDETTGSVLISQRPAWQTVHTAGGKMFVAGDSTLVRVADLLDTGVVAGTLNTTEVPTWHNYGNKILNYNNPQVGAENSELYRQNYGVALWRSGYDGAMDYAYQHMFGQSIWNDYDTPHVGAYYYREHVFAYPITEGIIDTIQWEGWREGVDDARFANTLSHNKGNTISATAIINNGLSEGWDMSIIRGKLIDAILGGSIPPTAEFSASPLSGRPSPLTVWFTDLSYDSPTSWRWSYNNGTYLENLLTYSQQFNRSVWNNWYFIVTTDNTTSPDGTTTGDLLYVNASGGNKAVGQVFDIAPDTIITASVYLKADNSSSTSFGIYDGGWVSQNGKIESGPGTLTGATYKTVTGLSTTEWTRVSVTTNQGLVAATHSFSIYPNGSANLVGDSVYLWGAQLREGTAPGTYVETLGTNLSAPWAQFSTAQNPSYPFTTGTYDIRLITSNAEGSSTEEKYGYITVSNTTVTVRFINGVETGILVSSILMTILPIVLIMVTIFGILAAVSGGDIDPELLVKGIVVIAAVIFILYIVFIIFGSLSKVAIAT